MNNRFTYFLLVAEELNMSRAAERAYVSHQGISTTIKLLEKEYGVPLFYRTPKLTLTPEGETLVRALRKIKIIEDNLMSELHENNTQCHGKILLGVPLSRYEIFVPDLIPSFKAMYPNIEVEVIGDFSAVLEQKAKNSEIDLYISSGMIEDDQITVVPLMKEEFVLLISHAMLLKHFPSISAEQIDQWQRGVSLKTFENVPYIQTPANSRLYHAVNQYAEDYAIHLNPVFESNHVSSFGMLCRKNLGMAVVSQIFVPLVHHLNENCLEGEYVYSFPLKDFHYCKTISLGYHSDRYLSKCYRDFIKLIQDTFHNYQDNMTHLL